MTTEESQIEVCNIALALLNNQSEIASISTPTTPEESACAKFFNTARKSILRCHDWPFARAPLTITGVDQTDAPIITATPADCIRVLECLDSNGDQIEFAIMGNEIHTETAPAKIIYTSDVEDIQVWDSTAKDALIQRMAKDLATLITGKISAWEKHANELERILQKAKFDASRERNKNWSTGDRRTYPEIMQGK